MSLTAGRASRTVERLFAVLQVVLVATPWLSPLVYGPAPAVPGRLLAWAALALLLLGWPYWNPRTLAWGWLAAAVISSVIGLCQYFGVDHYFAPWMSTADGAQAYGNLRQRNQLATLLCIGWVALLYLVHRKGVVGRRRHLAAMGAAACLLALGLAASFSRTGLAELLALLGLAWFWGWWNKRQARQLLALGCFTYLVAAYLLPQLTGGAGESIVARLQGAGPDCTSRWTLWSNMLELIRQHPWAGWGWGELGYAHFVTRYDGMRQCEMLDNAHNLPLHLAVELGLPITALICAALVWMTWRAKPWREAEPTRQMAWGVLMMIMLHSLVEYPLWYGPFQMTALLSLGLLVREPDPGAAWARIGGKLSGRCVAVAIVVTTVYGAWDYFRVSQIYLPLEQRSPAYRENTLEKIRGSWLFSDQVRFAAYTLTPLTPDNAAQLNVLGHALLHFSPEARVVEKLMESAILLERGDEAAYLRVRYQAAYPQDYARWLKNRGDGGTH